MIFVLNLSPHSVGSNINDIESPTGPDFSMSCPHSTCETKAEGEGRVSHWARCDITTLISICNDKSASFVSMVKHESSCDGSLVFGQGKEGRIERTFGNLNCFAEEKKKNRRTDRVKQTLNACNRSSVSTVDDVVNL